MAKADAAPSAYFRKQDWAYHQARSLILSGGLPAGTPIDQEELAASLGISRIPLREALSRLSAEGWLQNTPHRRMVVPGLSLADARDIYCGRAAVESTLASRAAARGPHGDLAAIRTVLDDQRDAFARDDLVEFRSLDRRFHLAVYELAGMPKTLGTATQLYNLGERYVHLYLGTAERSSGSLTEHAAILDAVERGEPDLAESLTRTHISHGLDVLENHLLPPGDAPDHGPDERKS